MHEELGFPKMIQASDIFPDTGTIIFGILLHSGFAVCGAVQSKTLFHASDS
jgi:hypothetical protein